MSTTTTGRRRAAEATGPGRPAPAATRRLRENARSGRYAAGRHVEDSHEEARHPSGRSHSTGASATAPAAAGGPAIVSTSLAPAAKTTRTAVVGTPIWPGVLRGLVRVILAVTVGAAVAAFLFLAVGPRVLGYQTSTMLTGSMSPLINPGDVVVTVPVSVGEIKVGDIITYHIPVGQQQVETHRVIEVSRNAQGPTTVRTKGDANNGADPWTATLAGDTVYRHTVTVPYLGTVIRALRDPVLLKVLMYGAPAVLLIGALTSLWKNDVGTRTASPRRRPSVEKNA